MDFLHNIAVIGAGMAGLTAARALQQAGKSVQVFDKGRRPGGRMSTRANAYGLFDLGAQYFSVRDSEFARFIETFEQRGVVTRWPGVMAHIDSGRWQTRQPEHPRYSGTPSMVTLTEAMAAPLEVHSQVRITSLSHESSQWVLRDQEERVWPGFDHVIVAIPAPQARELLGSETALRWALPEMSSCWSTWVRFNTPLSMPAGVDTWDGVSFDDSPVLRWAARNQTRPGRSEGERLTLLARDDWSDRYLERDPVEIADDMVSAFRACYPEALPAVEAQGAHRWRYAQPRAPIEKGPGYRLDEEMNLSLCGDWCIDGRVEAAWQSGHRLAQALCHL
ncbi:hypothetical protein SAMN05421848_0736 [Kushneria avicenniae]|uniref:Amine oxidase domain-containing protein n=1 Tax=Kushneria avicenniae TaxID=402385 RepID=A0A1I1HK76_9GAMM|nr:FAD-dependent oxidoreductase [Kushneria avicenniae]SFC24477.1 hypothetical protein SAMN05421848_0736 [Kushneria avicenniae]